MQDTPTIPQTYQSAQIPEYTPTDVRLAMRSQRPWNSAPRWAAPVSAWRICEEECIASVCEIWTQTALQGAPPDTWRRHETCHIPKPQKDPTIPDNLRPINLTCPLHRSYLYQLNRDMQNHLLHKWRDTTYGALPRRSAAYAMVTIMCILHTAKKEKQKQVFILCRWYQSVRPYHSIHTARGHRRVCGGQPQPVCTTQVSPGEHQAYHIPGRTRGSHMDNGGCSTRLSPRPNILCTHVRTDATANGSLPRGTIGTHIRHTWLGTWTRVPNIFHSGHAQAHVCGRSPGKMLFSAPSENSR